MTAITLEQRLAFRYDDTFELLKERGFWATVKRLVILKYETRRLIRDLRVHVEGHAEQLKKNHLDVSELEKIRTCFSTLTDSTRSLLKSFEGITTKILLRSEIPELRQIYDTLEDLLENVELTLDPTFKRGVEHALSGLPPEVSSKAKEELNEWLHRS